MSSSMYNAGPAVISTGHFNEETRKHPPFAYLEVMGSFFRSDDHSKFADFFDEEHYSVRTPHAHHLKDGETSFKHSVKEFWHGPFKTWKPSPISRVAIETPNGYDLYTQLDMFADLTGHPAAHEKKVRDEEGKEWDVQVPIFFYHELVKIKGAPHQGLKCRHVRFVRDTGFVNDILDKRGVKRHWH